MTVHTIRPAGVPPHIRMASARTPAGTVEVRPVLPTGARWEGNVPPFGKQCRCGAVWAWSIATTFDGIGREVSCWYCRACWRRAAPGWQLPNKLRDAVRKVHEPLPIWMRDKFEIDERPPCDACGKEAEHIHHWAPRFLFDDAHKWPTSWLCQPCHRRWHKVVTDPLLKAMRKRAGNDD